jgi:hypothetical protein
LESTVNDMDRDAAVHLMKVLKDSKLLLKGAKRTPKGYSRTKRWDGPLAKAPRGRSFEMDSNLFLNMMTKDLKVILMSHGIEEMIFEVSRLAGMLAFSNAERERT